MKLSICSYSFHELLEAGKQDMFKYITDCKELGCTQLDPWNVHLAPIQGNDETFKANATPDTPLLSAEEEAYLVRVKKAADDVGLPFGCVAVDGAHIYEPTEKARRANRLLAYRWITVAERLGAPQVRIDAGGTPELPDDMFAIVIEGFKDIVAYAKKKGVEVIHENHWGSTNVPENVVRIMEAVDGLGLLFDSCNWAKGMREKGWELCAKYASTTHIKTFAFDEQGYETTVDVPRVMQILIDGGYDGCWGIESCPEDGDEYAGVRKTIALMKRVLGEA